MPTYVYEYCTCPSEERDAFDKQYPDAQTFDTFELNVPISQRDTVKCVRCDEPLKRKVAFTGLTWAPTAGGMR